MRTLVIILFWGIGFLEAKAQPYYLGPVNYKTTVTYPDHTITFYTKPVRNEVSPNPLRIYYWYSANQIKSTQGGYSGRLLNGPYSDFYINRNLREQGSFRNGLKNGRWNSWTETGILEETISWRSGELDGKFYRYNDEGKIKEAGNYRKGSLHGKFRSYSSPDSAITSYYKRGTVTVKKNIMPGFLRNAFKKKSTP